MIVYIAKYLFLSMSAFGGYTNDPIGVFTTREKAFAALTLTTHREYGDGVVLEATTGASRRMTGYWIGFPNFRFVGNIIECEMDEPLYQEAKAILLLSLPKPGSGKVIAE